MIVEAVFAKSLVSALLNVWLNCAMKLAKKGVVKNAVGQ